MNIQKHLLTLSSLLVTTLSAAPSGLYIDAGIGLGLNDTFETSTVRYVFERRPLIHAALGYQYNTFRVEIEERYNRDALYSASAQDAYSIPVTGDITRNSQMLNFYYNGYNESRLMSSVGFGAGISAIDLQDTYKEKSVPSFQGLFSIGYQLHTDLITSLNYAYFYTLESDSFKSESQSSLTFSLRYIF